MFFLASADEWVHIDGNTRRTLACSNNGLVMIYNMTMRNENSVRKTVHECNNRQQCTVSVDEPADVHYVCWKRMYKIITVMKLALYTKSYSLIYKRVR